MKNRVSIITPCFNRIAFIEETANSVLSQTYVDWEWVIVDDGSTDGSLEMVNELATKDTRIKVYQRDREPKGATTCRNMAVEKCTGEFLIFLDTDDLLVETCIENRINAVTSSGNLDFGVFPSLLFRNKPFDLRLWWNVDNGENLLSRQFKQDAICQGTGILIRKDSFVKLGMWDNELMLWQDIDMFFRLYIQDYKYKVFFDLPPDLHIRRLETSLSRADFFNINKQRSRIAVVKKACALLEDSNKSDLVRQLKYMSAEILSGLWRSKNWQLSNQFLTWCKSVNMYDVPELKALNYLRNYYYFRLYKFNFAPRKFKSKTALFKCESLLGKVTFDQVQLES